MSLMDKMERKFGKTAIPNLMKILIGAYVAGFVMARIFPQALNYLVFSPAEILRGQVWRLITFIVYPNTNQIFMVLITCFIYFSISQALERAIGRFRVNFFLISGILMLDVIGMLYYFLMPEEISLFIVIMNPYYLYAMLFVLFSLIYPDVQFLLMFIIPVRGKYMVFITLAMYLLDIIEAMTSMPAYGYALVAMVIAAILNMILYLLLTGYSMSNKGRNQRNQNVVNMRNFQKAKQASAQKASAVKQPRHQCSYCKRTDLTDPDLEFRYCSKCAGNYEFCMEHLYTHIHVTNTGNGPENMV